MKKKRRRKIKTIRLLLVILITVLLVFGVIVGINFIKEELKTENYYLANDRPTITLIDENGNPYEYVRGTQITVKVKPVEIAQKEYRKVVTNNKPLFVEEKYLTTDKNKCVLEESLYTLRNTVINEAVGSYKIAGYVKKNTQVQITGYNTMDEFGKIDYYQIDGLGYVSADKLDYEYHYDGYNPSVYAYADHYGGDPTLLDYYPKQQTNFENNQMPEVVKALYINANGICMASDYVEIADGSEINAFVVDIKDCYDDTQLAYNSPLKDIYAPSTSNIPNTYEEYKSYIKILKDAGYYIIGRITAFKDDSFAYDNPEEALLQNGEVYRYSGVGWPSIFSRKLWEYDVALGLEAVNEMGFDEIQYDYVRMPESVDSDVDTQNKYNESRVEAITEFLRYASECLHANDAYISADVFGETSGWSTSKCTAFVTSYGQYWPAFSNVVDAISSMPYPDHYGPGSFGIDRPYANPGAIMTAWAKATKFAQDITYDGAKIRTWILAQDPYAYTYTYECEDVQAQLDALKSENVYDGFMTWNSAGSRTRYRKYIDVLK